MGRIKVAGITIGVLAGVAWATMPALASAECKVAVAAELPVTMAGRRPMVTAKFGDKTARFILDSGAFYSTLSLASAQEFGLKVIDLPFLHVRGVGGSANAGAATATNFSIAGIPLRKVDFVVAGSDTGSAGLLGQNILGVLDVEYDLPHGVVRLIQTKGCGSTNLAYWANGRPASALKLIGRNDGMFKPHTVGKIQINGGDVNATFDTGAESSLLSRSVAKRLGVTPDSAGVTSVGFGSGIGRRGVQTWRAPFTNIDIGGEKLNRPVIRIADMEMGDTDMLVGIDFFLTHRVFVSNATRTMFFTYEGGPLFGQEPRRAVTDTGAVIDLSDRSPAPTDAAGYSRRGAAFASNGRRAAALADFDKAIAMAPGEGHYYYQRAMLRLSGSRDDFLQGRGDLDRAITLTPDDAEARLTRAAVRIRADERAGALDDVRVADRVLAPSADQRLRVAAMLTELGQPEDAVGNIDRWLKSHPEDHSRATAFNGRCWARAVANIALDEALSDCDRALKLRPNAATYLDSRAFVYLRQGAWARAIADYDEVLRREPANAWSRYARAVALKRSGDTTRGDAERTAALKLEPHVEARAKRYNLIY